eukprot:1159052-Pelagomonas_calceolata.AAC.13
MLIFTLFSDTHTHTKSLIHPVIHLLTHIVHIFNTHAAELAALEQELDAEVKALREGRAALQELEQQQQQQPQQLRQQQVLQQVTPAPRLRPPGSVGSAGTPAPQPSVTPPMQRRSHGRGGDAEYERRQQGVDDQGEGVQGPGVQEERGAAAGMTSQAAVMAGGNGREGIGVGGVGLSGRYAQEGSEGGGVMSNSSGGTGQADGGEGGGRRGDLGGAFGSVAGSTGSLAFDSGVGRRGSSGRASPSLAGTHTDGDEHSRPPWQQQQQQGPAGSTAVKVSMAEMASASVQPLQLTHVSAQLVEPASTVGSPCVTQNIGIA